MAFRCDQQSAAIFSPAGNAISASDMAGAARAAVTCDSCGPFFFVAALVVARRVHPSVQPSEFFVFFFGRDGGCRARVLAVLASGLTFLLHAARAWRHAMRSSSALSDTHTFFCEVQGSAEREAYAVDAAFSEPETAAQPANALPSSGCTPMSVEAELGKGMHEKQQQPSTVGGRMQRGCVLASPGGQLGRWVAGRNGLGMLAVRIIARASRRRQAPWYAAGRRQASGGNSGRRLARGVVGWSGGPSRAKGPLPRSTIRGGRRNPLPLLWPPVSRFSALAFQLGPHRTFSCADPAALTFFYILPPASTVRPAHSIPSHACLLHA